MSTAKVTVSDAFLAQLLEQHMPWPEGTKIKVVDEGSPEGVWSMEFRVTSDEIPLGTDEVTPVWQRGEDGVVRFFKWQP